jgi:hypothetical protein
MTGPFLASESASCTKHRLSMCVWVTNI